MFDPRTKRKLSEWFGRYGWPSIHATVAEFLVAVFTYHLSGSMILSAVLASWADNFVFYGIVAWKDLKERRTKDRRVSFFGLLKVSRNLFVEFGPAEYIDSFLVRPLFLAAFPAFISPYPVGVLVGSAVVDVIYWVPVLFFYESRKRLIKD